MKKRILFVDDNQQMLTAIRRMLWSAQDRWEMNFLRSGDEALELLSRQHHDVIVADMRMPGMDGRRLLRTVRKQYPWMMRLLLSGESNLKSILRSAPEAHQFLTKPVSAEQLSTVIERGCCMRDMILSHEIKSIIGKIDVLPAQPAVYEALLTVLDDEAAPVEAISVVIAKDVALSADILKLVNSSFFGPRVKVRSLKQAVTLLGMETIKGLVLGLQLVKIFDTRKIPEFSFPRLWEHSLATARLARQIAILEGLSPEAQDDSYIAGMLHDLGKFVLADKLTAEYQRVVETARNENVTIDLVESREFGAVHAQAGAYLLGLWGLSDSVLEAVAFHHAPKALGITEMSVLAAVHVANVLEHELVVINPDYAKHSMDMEYLSEAGLADRLDTWKLACREALMEGAAQ